MIDLTPIARPMFVRRARRTDSWNRNGEDTQRRVLAVLLRQLEKTCYGRVNHVKASNSYREFVTRVPLSDYSSLEPWIMRMVRGESDVLWPGLVKRFAQSSGTSSGRSKYIPITSASLRMNHYRGTADVVAHYLRAYPGSRLFSGKGLILGGSFANTLPEGITGHGIKVGDLSATLIEQMPGVSGMFRAPTREIALMEDWEEKLPAIAKSVEKADLTNLSGVPSWMLTLLRRVLDDTGCGDIKELWPNMEVFFHGGISFAPYRGEYARIAGAGMRYMENYNASEGFFACQNDPDDPAMLLLIDGGVFYEFIPVGTEEPPVPLWEVERGKIYELVVSGVNGLWRYRPGDTVRIESTAPVKVTVAGRTSSFINAFGEEVMEHNAEAAITAACAEHQASVRNYTVAPRYSRDGRRGCHEWYVEWETAPADTAAFASTLDRALQSVNSDYEAKRSGGIFLDPAEVITVAPGTFEHWLATHGTGRLGGQRKVPRLCNDRRIADELLAP